MRVRYRRIKEFPLYLVGDDGSVWSSHWKRWHRLSPRIYGKCGYRMVSLCRPGCRARRPIHHLVLIAFVGPCPEGMECCHEDGDPSNNRLSNLRWDTHQANMDDRERHGRQPRGESHHLAKIKDDDVVEIRQLYATGKYSQRKLASRYGVTQSLICAVVNRTRRYGR